MVFTFMLYLPSALPTGLHTYMKYVVYATAIVQNTIICHPIYSFNRILILIKSYLSGLVTHSDMLTGICGLDTFTMK